MCSIKYLLLLSIIFYNEHALVVSGDQKSSSCIVPPKPVNGNYTTYPKKVSAGDAVASFLVSYTCKPGYSWVGPKRISCYRGVWDQTPHIAECIPHCTIDNEPSIVTCAAVKRCIIPDTYNAKFTKPNIQSRNRYLLTDCGEPSGFTYVISGGMTVLIKELPWHSAIYTKTTKPYKQICGGTLVTTTVVISAAHCFWSDVSKLLPAADFAVAVGKQYRPWANQHDKSQHSDVAEIKVPPRFRGAAANFQDDLALVILSTPVQYDFNVKPVCLDFDRKLEEEQLQPGNLGKVAGWGLTSEDGNSSQVLKAVELPYVEISRCIDEAPPSFVSAITSDKICAGYNNGTAVCRGDSGGGLSFESEGRYYLRGVVSAAPSDAHACNTHARGAFTLLSKHRTFIEDNLANSQDVTII